MAKKCKPYHSIDSEVCHIFSDCTVGNNIKRDNKRPRSDGKRLCKTCQDIRDGKRKE